VFNIFASQTDKIVLNADYPSIVTDGLVLNLDAGFVPSYPRSGTTWSDISLSGNSGTLVNGPTYSSEDGGSIVFDGVDDYGIFQNCNFNTTTGATFLFISTNNSTNNNQSPFGYHRSYWTIRSSQTYLYIGYGGIEHSSSFETATSFPNTGTNLRHLAVKVSGSSGSFYKDGINIGNFSGMPSTIDSNSTMYVGRRGISTPYSYNGSILLIQVYNRPLSDTEIQQNYYSTLWRFLPNIVQNGLVLYLDAGSSFSYVSGSTSWYNLVSSGSTGTLTNGPTYVSDNGGGISFDGANDYVTCGTILDNLTELTLNVVIDGPNLFNGYGGIIMKTSTGNWTDGFGIYYEASSNTYNFYINNWSSNRLRYTISGTNQTNPINITGTYKQSEGMKLYINGSLHSSNTMSSAINNPSNIRLNLGCANSFQYFYRGRIYYAQVYDKSLTSNEVLQNYNATKSRFGL
jgi:hypothetical protein